MSREVTELEIDTPAGLARAHMHPVDCPSGLLVLGHGAGGGVGAPDLVSVAGRAQSQGFAVALIEQPYRVAGKRSQPAASRLDAAWIAVVEDLRAGPLGELALIVGGRSAGARVACRTAAQTGADAVLCLAFPLQPPPRSGKPPGPSRLAELDAVEAPLLAVQGERDRFGIPPESVNRSVVRVAGDHGLKADAEAVGAAVSEWLKGLADQA